MEKRRLFELISSGYFSARLSTQVFTFYTLSCAVIWSFVKIEIAELTGKQHKDVLKAIRNMEPSWEKVCGRNFALTSRTIVQPNGGTREVPCYSLTKTECLYIATKFNDEARAKLVLRDMGIQ